MTRGSVFSVLVLVTALGGCSRPVDGKLEGRWYGESVENVGAESIAVATGWARGTSMEFAGNSLTVSVPAEEPKTAEFDVASVKGKKVTLRVKRPDGEVDEARFWIDGEKSMRWDIGDGRAIVMRREL